MSVCFLRKLRVKFISSVRGSAGLKKKIYLRDDRFLCKLRRFKRSIVFPNSLDISVGFLETLVCTSVGLFWDTIGEADGHFRVQTIPADEE